MIELADVPVEQIRRGDVVVLPRDVRRTVQRVDRYTDDGETVYVVRYTPRGPIAEESSLVPKRAGETWPVEREISIEEAGS